MFGIAVWLRVTSMRIDEELQQPRAQEQTASLGQRGESGARNVSDASAPAAAPEPYEIVESGSPTSGRAMSERERRYQELLKSAPPAAPAPATQQAEPSLLDRMVAPIASALGIGQQKPAPATPQPKPQPRTPQSQPQAKQEEARQPDPSEREPQRRDEEEDDPESDLIPPQLMAAEFYPAQVQDGQETTLAVVVNDNLSGVRSVSGVIASPSGALQGFACRREGETARFTAKVIVPKDAAEGTWMVRYMTLTDNATNSVNLNASQGALPQTASFRVTSSGSDSRGPVLSRVWIQDPAMKAGDRNTVFVEAEDDKSGVSLVSGVFVSPAKQARLGFGCRAGAAGVWECPLSPPACLDCGDWQLEQIQLQDKANNMATFRADNQDVAGVRVNITSEACDADPPRIVSMTLDPLVVSNEEGGTIRVEAVLADDTCGVASLSGQAVPANNTGGQRAYFSFDPSADGKTFIGRIVVEKHAAKGIWNVAWLQALDRGHNLRSYPTNDPVISRVTFRVE